MIMVECKWALRRGLLHKIRVARVAWLQKKGGGEEDGNGDMGHSMRHGGGDGIGWLGFVETGSCGIMDR
jgi:hypothetical protein